MENSEYNRLLLGLGQALSLARNQANMTQEEFGEKLGKGQSAVAKVERSPSPNIALRVLYEMASALGMSLSELLRNAEKIAGLDSEDLSSSRKAMLDSSQKKAIEMLVSKSLKKANDDIVRQLTSFDT